jgi:EmrB/QacA subfamily drug resistance transporter
MSSTSATAPATDGALTHKQILTILTGLMLGMFLAALDQTIVATAIRTIGDDLNGLSAQAWVTTAFLITSTITTPLYGKLSDIYGRKPLFMIAITIFLVGSALCGLAQNMYMLAAFRAFQGIGAGGLFSLALAIMGDLIAPRERARYQGYFMAVFATSSVLGPVVGGFFAGQQSILGITGWRWIFYINIPIGLVALIVVNRTLHMSHQRRDHRIDWLGATALVVGLVPLLIVAEQGRLWGWASPVAFACYLVGLAGLVGFVYVEGRMGDDALIPLRLFRNRVFAVGSAQSTIIGVGLFGGVASIPLYLQIVKGASPTEAGLLILPMVGGIMAASMIAGQITSRTGRYRIFPIIGSALLVIGMLLLYTIGAHTPLWQTDLYMIVFGAGLGLNMQSIILAMQNAVPVRDMGVATSSVTFFRQLGGSLGTAVFLSILFSTAPTKIAERFQAAGVRVPAGAINLNNTSNIQSLPPAVKEPILGGFSDAMNLVFLVGACVLVGAFVLSLMMKEVPLRQMSGIEQARADAGAAAAAAASQDGHAAAGPDGAVVASAGRSAADGVSRADGAVPAARPPGGR